MIARLPDLHSLLPEGACGVASPIPVTGWALHEIERRAVRSVSERRLLEFTAGRYCAHQALMQLGIQDVAIPPGNDRAPIWPPGVIGSISHSSTCAVAVAAQATGDLLSLGVDVEEAEPLEKGLIGQIGVQQEYDILSGLDRPPSELGPRLLFSMKEAVFKCLFHRFREFLDFSDLLLVDAGNQCSFIMERLQRSASERLRVHGRFGIGAEFICCTAALHRRDAGFVEESGRADF